MSYDFRDVFFFWCCKNIGFHRSSCLSFPRSCQRWSCYQKTIWMEAKKSFLAKRREKLFLPALNESFFLFLSLWCFKTTARFLTIYLSQFSVNKQYDIVIALAEFMLRSRFVMFWFWCQLLATLNRIVTLFCYVHLFISLRWPLWYKGHLS